MVIFAANSKYNDIITQFDLDIEEITKQIEIISLDKKKKKKKKIEDESKAAAAELAAAEQLKDKNSTDKQVNNN